jgi:hypothetical protein
VIAFMRRGTSRDLRKDQILRPIFEAHAEDEDPRWRAVLLAIFWPALGSIHFQKRHWDTDPDELWQSIVWIFLQVLCRVDVKRRPDRLVQKVFNDTVHRLCAEYRRVWNRADREVYPEPGQVEAMADLKGVDLAEIDRRREQEAELKRLREHLDAGRISEADFFLILGTRVYGRSIPDHARGTGLNPEAAKKRRQRAEAAIRRHETEM